MSKFSDWLSKSLHGKRIVMMGLRQSGKSQFLKSLGCKDARPGTESSKEYFNWFKVNCPPKPIFVKAGYDFGGDVGHFKEIFVKSIKEADYVFFVVDVRLFMMDGIDIESKQTYKKQALARLDFINENVSVKFKDKVAIVLTHADLVNEPSESLISEFQRATNGKAYQTLTRHCYPIDARVPEQVLDAFTRIMSI